MNCFWQASVCGCRVLSDFTGRTSHGVDVSIKLVIEGAQKVQAPMGCTEPSLDTGFTLTTCN